MSRASTRSVRPFVAAGLVLSFETKVPSGPAIILTAAALYVGSVFFGSVGGLFRQMFPGRHLEA